ncbi:DNA repair protein SWI5 homolog [Limulus polyphemus]|uniref:DNA repair protein SWI5 homolog n=1 Tax=Limulus polyphemus TaxID=6850 RepID=A0ABM1B643_LIMPO|nr:DNA repair protein SWI5 homolog [Limulus polyphemus]XP_013775581.1 DNA repair protein SWI5 homolog [Limulus polyphemus]XP_022242852.1 DNA repair protein SWI5 homolog [Limulus polyphemus]XP_022242853.1 DNA repair protein SWI5 homolog [Limulus polyphemus]
MASSTPKHHVSSMRKRLSTPYARQLSASFKSPVMKSNKETPKQTSILTLEEMQEQISLLEERNQELDMEIELLQSQGFRIEELQWHIDKLHEYNEIKDAAQCVLGQLASLDGATVKELHERYGLTMDD